MKEIENLITKINAMATNTVDLIETAREHYMICDNVVFKFDDKKGKIMFIVKKFNLTDAQYREVLARISQAKKSSNMLSNLLNDFYHKLAYMDDYMQQYYSTMLYSVLDSNLQRNKDEVREKLYKTSNCELPIDYNVYQIKDSLKTKKTTLTLLTEISQYAFNKCQEINSKQM